MNAIVKKSVLATTLAGTLLLAVAPSAFSQKIDLDQAAQAVVRIRACDASGCDRGVGSGVIIDPSGVILTANHVTLSNAEDPLSDAFRDFIVEMTADWREIPKARYRASLAASDRTNDLALLQVYWDEIEQVSINGVDLSLPALPMADIDEVVLGEPLHFLGYPLLGGATINYLDLGLSGFDGKDDTLLKVTGALPSGYSGGPALVKAGDGFHILGVVVRQRIVQGQDRTAGQVSLIRSVDKLSGLDWRPTAQRMWVDEVRIAAGDAADNAFTIELDVRALDFSAGRGRAMAYAYDAASGKPWTPQPNNLPTTIAGQVVLSADFAVSGFLGRRWVTLQAPTSDFRNPPNELAFRIVLWDTMAARAAWRDPEWRRPQATSASPVRRATPWPLPTGLTATQSEALPVVRRTATPTPLAASNATSMPMAPTCRVLVSGLRLRTGPGTAYQAKGLLDLDVKMMALARNAATSWIQVQTSPGLRGWIANASAYVACNELLLDLPIGDTPPLPSPTAVRASATADGPTAVKLLTPPDGTNSRDEVDFSWTPNAALADGQVYELVFWVPNKGHSHEVGSRSWQAASAATVVTLDAGEHAADTYAWGVWLGIFDEEGRYSRMRYLGGGRAFTVPASRDRDRDGSSLQTVMF